ncbi:hypothetical protein OO014_07180 [Intrasporangium calvum]|uniref:Uncharacterized protein n=1 Tax=Intrasporangium calvum TaxID=53358 RepID=A0ABT5GG09_9MICO|nr:hypothetical protein [Intrasporangium calvum]MDC5697038.1 hypothetical protein [Intrasporangium calvum]
MIDHALGLRARGTHTITGSDGVKYVVEALPSGVIGWQYEASAFDFGLILALARGLWNLMGRLVFGCGWQLKVTRKRARWPHWSKVVARRRFRKKEDALAGFSQLVEEIHTRGPAML